MPLGKLLRAALPQQPLLWVDGALDPYVARAEAAGAPHLLRQWRDADGTTAVYALFLHVPHNGLTVQLRSRALADPGAARLFEPCSPS